MSAIKSLIRYSSYTISLLPCGLLLIVSHSRPFIAVASPAHVRCLSLKVTELQRLGAKECELNAQRSLQVCMRGSISENAPYVLYPHPAAFEDCNPSGWDFGNPRWEDLRDVYIRNPSFSRTHTARILIPRSSGTGACDRQSVD